MGIKAKRKHLLLCWVQNSVCLETSFGLKSLMENLSPFQWRKEPIFWFSPTTIPPNLPFLALLPTPCSLSSAGELFVCSPGRCSGVLVCECVRTHTQAPLFSQPVGLILQDVARRLSCSLTVTEDKDETSVVKRSLQRVWSSPEKLAPREDMESDETRCQAFESWTKNSTLTRCHQATPLSPIRYWEYVFFLNLH